ncbi:hypothetical protein CLU79DRAFT_715028 [Phycomyces nitens]|nr:hypothetical protein CLU79DRAFT_715028 [Phycomyces nitens]
MPPAETTTTNPDYSPISSTGSEPIAIFEADSSDDSQITTPGRQEDIETVVRALHRFHLFRRILPATERPNSLGFSLPSTAVLSLLCDEDCKQEWLTQYLTPDGEFDPGLAVLAAAVYEQFRIDGPVCCRDVLLAGEELYGEDWPNRLHPKGRNHVLDKLSTVAHIQQKLKDSGRLETVDHAIR